MGYAEEVAGESKDPTVGSKGLDITASQSTES